MKKQKTLGFTLIELLLVMAIIASFIVLGVKYMQQRTETTRIDKTVLQMQYLLNAGISYYLANGGWPGTAGTIYTYSAAGIGGLQGTYIPDSAMTTPFGGFYSTYYQTSGTNPPANNFVARVDIDATDDHYKQVAQIVANKLPMSTISINGNIYSVLASVPAPGQALNNATAIRFAGLYHHGACVPTPDCPNTSSGGGAAMTPQVFVVPVSVSGVNDENADNNIYPISSFTAYATGGTNVSPPPCTSGDTPPDCTSNNNGPTVTKYWRACVQIITERGNVQETRADDWGDNVTLGAFVRCAAPNESAGSDYTIFSH